MEVVTDAKPRFAEPAEAIEFSVGVGCVEAELRIAQKWERGAWSMDVPDFSALPQAGLGEVCGESTRRDVRDAPDIIDRCDGSSASDDDSHRHGLQGLL